MELLVRKELLNFNFKGNINSQKYLYILKNSIDKNIGHPIKFLLRWNNHSKHRSEHLLDYYIQHTIQISEWPAYSPNSNPRENVFVNKNKYIGIKVENKIELFKDYIKTDW